MPPQTAPTRLALPLKLMPSHERATPPPATAKGPRSITAVNDDTGQEVTFDWDREDDPTDDDLRAVFQQAESWEGPEDRSIGGFATNALKSAGRFAGDAASALGTAAKIGLFGGHDPLTPTKAFAPALQPLVRAAASPIQTAKAVGSHFGDRYGSVDKALTTAYEDPIGMAADVASVASLGGGAAARVPGLARAGRAAQAVGSAVDPVVNVARAGTAAGTIASGGGIRGVLAGDGGFGAMLKQAGRNTMQSAIKPSAAIERRNPGIDLPTVAIEEGINPTARGLARLQDRIEVDENAINAAIAGSTATVDPLAAARPVRDVIREQRAVSAVNRPGLAQAQAVAREFLTDQATSTPRTVQVTRDVPSGLVGPDGRSLLRQETTTATRGRQPAPVPVQQAQAMKRELGRQMRPTFGVETPGAVVDAKQSLRRGLRQEIERAVPEVGRANAQLGRRLALEDALIETVRRAGRPTFGVREAAGGMIGGPKGAMAAALWENPAVKGMRARALSRTGAMTDDLDALLREAGPALTRAALLEALGTATADDDRTNPNVAGLSGRP